MRRAQRLAQRHLRTRLRCGLGGWRTAGRGVVVRRRPHELSGCHHDCEVGAAEQHERARDAVCFDQCRCQRTCDEGSEPEPGHRETGDETALVGEPFDQYGERDDVSQAEADASQDSVKQVEGDQVRREAGENEAASIKDAGDGRGRARSDPALETAAEPCGYTEHRQGDGER